VLAIRETGDEGAPITASAPDSAAAAAFRAVAAGLGQALGTPTPAPPRISFA
jgi:ATP-binding protein involved in chromosome partitioning